MDDFWLPKELDHFLGDGLQLQYDVSFAEPGQITLVGLSDLHLDTFGVHSFGKEQARNDPNKGRSGHYEIPGVNLVLGCDGYSPKGILLWVPNERAFGTWDCDHGDLWLFPRATWRDISMNALPYVNSMWHSEGVDKKWLVPWPRYPFVEKPDGGFGARLEPSAPQNPPRQIYLFPD